MPAAHGGFETFAEKLALDLTARGWRVVVYCQVAGRGPISIDEWQGVQRVRIPVATPAARGTVLFDALAIKHAAAHRDLCLTLGYNTAVFCAWLRLRGIPTIINMDGIEWRRAKWSAAERSWLWVNEWIGGRVGDHVVADHPEIERHLRARGVPATKISMIPYGADRVVDAHEGPARALGVRPGHYLLVIARPEPENSLLEIVQGFVAEPGEHCLVILGDYDPTQDYHRRVKAAADGRVVFPGAIYDATIVRSLRRHALAYVHGHRVGGTNPSLVEALGAGSAVVAHENPFNRWVAGDAALYFDGPEGFLRCWRQLKGSPGQAETLRRAAARRFDVGFQWKHVLSQYRALLERFLP